jgi:hypothetical protein
MNMDALVKRYFPGGNTYKGFWSFFEEALAPNRRVFIIKGGPGTGKSTFIKSIGSNMLSQGYDLEYLCCSGDANSIDGVVIPKLGVAIVDGTAPHVIDPKNPGAVDEIINFGDVWDEDVLIRNKDSIVTINNTIKVHYKKAYENLRKAKDIRDEIEQQIVCKVQSDAIEQGVVKIFGEIINYQKINDVGKGINRFGWAITHRGIVSYFGELTRDITNKYILKGPSVKINSLILHGIEELLIEQGYSVERYHDCLEPELTDMIIVPELSLALVSRNYFQPSSAIGDGVVIDMTNILLEESDDFSELETQKVDMVAAIQRGVGEMEKSKNLHDKLEEFYIRAMDFDRLKQIKDRVLFKINSYMG